MHDCPAAVSIRPSGIAAAHAWQRRIHHLLLATAGIGLLSIGQVAAQDAAGPASVEAAVPAVAETTSPVKPGKNGKVCQYEDVTGSRMKKRTCYTPEQWEARERAAKELVRELDAKPVGKDALGG